jgi:hypothetical protein
MKSELSGRNESSNDEPKHPAAPSSPTDEIDVTVDVESYRVGARHANFYVSCTIEKVAGSWHVQDRWPVWSKWNDTDEEVPCHYAFMDLAERTVAER